MPFNTTNKTIYKIKFTKNLEYCTNRYLSGFQSCINRKTFLNLLEKLAYKICVYTVSWYYFIDERYKYGKHSPVNVHDQ